MEIQVEETKYYVNPDHVGGILIEMFEESLCQVKLPSQVKKEYFDIFIQSNHDHIDLICTKDIVEVYKIAHYLNSEQKMKIFGKEIARRLQLSTYNGIKEILGYFM
jgi:hypothetical protein